MRHGPCHKRTSGECVTAKWLDARSTEGVQGGETASRNLLSDGCSGVGVAVGRMHKDGQIPSPLPSKSHAHAPQMSFTGCAGWRGAGWLKKEAEQDKRVHSFKRQIIHRITKQGQLCFFANNAKRLSAGEMTKGR